MLRSSRVLCLLSWAEEPSRQVWHLGFYQMINPERIPSFRWRSIHQGIRGQLDFVAGEVLVLLQEFFGLF